MLIKILWNNCTNSKKEGTNKTEYKHKGEKTRERAQEHAFKSSELVEQKISVRNNQLQQQQHQQGATGDKSSEGGNETRAEEQYIYIYILDKYESWKIYLKQIVYVLFINIYTL